MSSGRRSSKPIPDNYAHSKKQWRSRRASRYFFVQSRIKNIASTPPTSNTNSDSTLNSIPRPVLENPLACIDHCSVSITSSKYAISDVAGHIANQNEYQSQDQLAKVPSESSVPYEIPTKKLHAGLCRGLIYELTYHMKIIQSTITETTHFRMDEPYDKIEFTASSGILLSNSSSNYSTQLDKTASFHITWISSKIQPTIMRDFFSFLIMASDKSSIHITCNVKGIPCNYIIMSTLIEFGFQRMINSSIKVETGIVNAETTYLFYRRSSSMFTLDHYMSIVSKQLVIKI